MEICCYVCNKYRKIEKLRILGLITNKKRVSENV